MLGRGVLFSHELLNARALPLSGTFFSFSYCGEHVLSYKSVQQLKVGWISECVSDVDFLAKPIVLKLGGSSLHTLVSSFVIWKQHLSAYTGKGVNLSELSNE